MSTQLEYILTHTHKSEMIAYLNSHQEEFREAVQLALNDKQPFSWRAAWLLWSCMEYDDRRIKKHLNKIIAILSFRNESHQRDLMMILQRMQLNDDQQSRLFDVCTEIWYDIKKKPSVRIGAIRLIMSVAMRHRELLSEVRLMTDTVYTETLSPGAKHSLNKMLTAIK